MPAPLLCRSCATRILASTSRLARVNRRLLHASAVDLGLPRIPHSLNPEQDPRKASVAPRSTGPISEANTTPRATSEARQLSEDESELYESQESLEALRKIVQSAGPASAIRKFFNDQAASDGTNPFADQGLSDPEARHATKQLKRLLHSNTESKAVLARLDQYVIWKTRFFSLLEKARVASTGSTKEQEEQNEAYEALNAAWQRFEAQSFEVIWRRAAQTERKAFWLPMVASALESSQHLLPAVFELTFDPSWCPSYVVEDVLYLLYRQYVSTVWGEGEDAASGGAALKEQICTIALQVLKNCPPNYLELEQPILGLLFDEVAVSELPWVLQRLEAMQHPLRSPTWLHAASRFAKDRSTKHRAKDILDSLTKRPMFNINSPAASSVCTSLLNIKNGEPFPDGPTAPDTLLKFLLERGWRPNLVGMTALMHNLCVRSLIEPAWKTLDLMLHLGLRPDSYTSSILLEASKKNPDADESSRISSVVGSDTPWTIVSFNSFLSFQAWTEERQLRMEHPYDRISRRQRKAKHNPWRLLLRCYSTFFDLAPLQKFVGFNLRQVVEKGDEADHRSADMAASKKPLEQPDSITLYLMLDAILRSRTAAEPTLHHYHRFAKLVEARDPSAMALLADCRTGVCDLFIRHLMQFRVTAAFAVRLVIKMTKDAAKERAQLQGQNRYHHPPSVHTWTCLLQGLKNHGHLNAVVSVFDMMVNLGKAQPNLAAWNSLVETFALEKNVGGAVKALWNIEAAGLQPNESTIRAFNMFPPGLKEQVIAQMGRLRASSSSGDGETAMAFNTKFAMLEKFNRRYHHVPRIDGPDPVTAPNSPFVFTLEELAAQLEDPEWIGRQPLGVNSIKLVRKTKVPPPIRQVHSKSTRIRFISPPGS